VLLLISHRLHNMTHPHSTSPPPLEKAAAHHRRRVLVLESDRLINALIIEWLQMAGCEIVGAHDLANAAALASSCDVVLADVPAPLKIARAAIGRLTRAVPGASVIAMSADVRAHGKAATDALARELGAAAVLVKPFSRKALLDAINRAAPERTPCGD
jgi:DNA-binding response OmpR family regulator